MSTWVWSLRFLGYAAIMAAAQSLNPVIVVITIVVVIEISTFTVELLHRSYLFFKNATIPSS